MTLTFVLGVALGLVWPGCPATWLALGTGLVGLIVMVSPVRFLLLCLFCLGAGATAGALGPPRPGTTPARSQQRAEAVVAAPPTRASYGCRVDVVRVWLAHPGGWRPGPPRVTLRLHSACPALDPGMRLRFRTRIRPGPSGRPWRAAVRPGGLARVGWATHPPQPSWIQRVRATAVQRIAPWRDPGRALVAAVVVGDRQWLGPHERARFRRTGTAHLLAISGLHVGLVTWICFWLMRRLWGLWPALAVRLAPARAAAVLALATTWLFVAVSGAATPALRAGVMTTALLVGPLWGRRSHAWAALALAAVILLLGDPSQLATPGFQLSFAAVAAILTVTRHLRAFEAQPETSAGAGTGTGTGTGPGHGRRWRARLVGLCAVTAAATLATLPLVAHHFGQASLAGLVLNLLVVPLFAAVVIPLGLAGTLLVLVFEPAGQPVLVAAAQAAELLQGLVAWGDASLSASLGLRWRPTGVQTACCYAMTMGLGWIRRPGGRVLLAVAMAVVLLSLALGRLGPGGGAALRVVFLDVGKGDAALITFPDGRHALVDAPGPTRSGWSATRRRVLPALDRLGVRRLHLVIVSHAHEDHIGGLPEVLRRLPTEAIWHSGTITTAPEARHLTRLAAERSVPLRRARDRRFGRVSLTVVGPRLRGRVHPHPLRSVNDNSLVILVRHPAGSVLFTGDLEQAGEAALLTAQHRYRHRHRHPRPLAATVLKVGHHGSPTASSAPFLRAVAPRLAILSAPGARPGRPFPSPRVLRRLRRAGARPLVTGREGDITVTIAPWGITYRSRSGTFHLTAKGWRPAPPWPSLTSVLRDPRILLP